MEKLGKPSRGVMASTVFRWAGARSKQVVRGPRPGVDVSVLEISDEKVMVLSTDPVSLIPALGPERSAWLSVHAVASDLATSGVGPKFGMFDLNLPPSITDAQLGRYWRAIHGACRRLGIAILGGHTGRFEGCGYTVIGGATFMAVANRQGFVTSDMAQDGDELIATKSAAVEATAVLAACFPNTVRRRAGVRVLDKARELMKQVSVVQDALTASSVGLRKNGLSAMHDVTEGGIVSAALEMADASQLKVELDHDMIPVYDGVREVCRIFRIDPFYSLGQGSLLIAASPNRSGHIMRVLRSKSINSAVIGRLAKTGRHSISDTKGKRRSLSYPTADPYWAAYWRGMRKRLT